MKNQKIIFTIDIDAFFAQVEENENPKYKIVPLVIAFELNNRGVVTTANYIARKYGIKSGQPIFEARKLVNNLVIIRPNHDKYVKISEEVFTIINKYYKKIEISSIDECYVDVTNFVNLNNCLFYAKKLQRDIYKATKLTVSIGISNDKILSKIASNFNKPNAISTLFTNEVEKKLWPLPIQKMFFIGTQTMIKLKKEGINTIGELAKLENDYEKYQKLKNIIGINLKKLILNSQGKSKLDVDFRDYLIKSISLAETFPFPVNDYYFLKSKIKEMTLQILKKLNQRALLCKTITLQTKDKPKKYVEFDEQQYLIKAINSKSFTFNEFTNDFDILYLNYIKLFDNWFLGEKNVNYIGISVSNFLDKISINKKQLELENYIKNDIEKNEDYEINQKSKRIIDDINIIFNKNILSSGENFKNIKRFNNKKILFRDNIKFKTWDKEK